MTTIRERDAALARAERAETALSAVMWVAEDADSSCALQRLNEAGKIARAALGKGGVMPHDWVNVRVFDGYYEHDRTIVKQCTRCRMLAIVGETATVSSVDYYPQLTSEREADLLNTITELRAKLAEAEARLMVSRAIAADWCAVESTAVHEARALVIEAAKLWHRGETQPEESRNENGLVAAVEVLLALEAETPEVRT